MPSADARARGPYDLLKSQGLGLAAGFATVLLLAVGSFANAALPEEAAPQLDDLTIFLREPSWHHAWFYALVPVLAVYALNATLCTLDQVARAWRAGSRALRTWAPAVFHVAFLVALAAHLAGGLRAEERGVARAGPDWTALPGGREVRVLSLDETRYPDGSTRSARAAVEVRSVDGTVETATVGYNEPLSYGLGTDLYLLVRHAWLPAEARVGRGDATCSLGPGGACDLGGRIARLVRIVPGAAPGDGDVAWLRVEPAAPGGEVEAFFLRAGASRPLADGTSVRVDAVAPAPLLLLRARHAPGDPLALVAALLLLAGVAMMGRRFVA